MTMSDSTFKDEKRANEKLINKIIEKCSEHKNNKELYICITCKEACCSLCKNLHQDHDIIKRMNIIKFNNELKSLNEEITKSLKESNLDNFYEQNNYIQNSDNIEKLQKRLDGIKKMHRNLYHNFRNELDKSLPYLLEFKEKIEELIENTYHLDTIKDEEKFLDYYYWYKNIKQKNEKIKKEIENVINKKNFFNKMIESFQNIIYSIYSKTDKEYKMIIQFNNNYNYGIKEEINRLNSNSLSPSKEDKKQSLPKMNLINLLNPNFYKQIKNQLSEEKIKDSDNRNDKEIIKTEKKITTKFIDEFKLPLNIKKSKTVLISQRRASKKYNFERIEEEPEIESQNSSNFKNKIYYNIKPNSQNLYCFDLNSKKVKEITVNLKEVKISHFDKCYSTLNFNNNFYFSGGNEPIKIFCKFNQKENNFIKLKDMPTFHISHGMVGFSNYIFIISGLKTKKVEKYNLNEEKWENLVELSYSRIWPSCLNYEDNYIYVFGGLNQNDINNDINDIFLIEKLNLMEVIPKWGKIKFNLINGVELPRNFGLINIKKNEFLLIGGRLNNKEYNNITYKIILNDDKIDIHQNEELIIKQNVEFNGKTFLNLGNFIFGEFCSSFNKFFIVDYNNKLIEEIE